MAKKTKTPQDRNNTPTGERGSEAGRRASQSAPAERSTVSERRSAPTERGGERTVPVADDRAGQVDRERIAARAYELYLQRGGSHGGELEDWLAAEREVPRASGQPTHE